MGNSWYMTHTK